MSAENIRILNTTKELPNNIEAEQIILGSILVNNEIFDEISYKKGGSVIRMMANFLGVDVFNKGIEEYLKKHTYGNAKQVKFD